MPLSDDDFEIMAHVPGSADFPDQWLEEAQAYRAREAAVGRARLNVPYGAGERQKFDLFHPAGKAEGVVVFIHGGYWMRFDRGFWSHYAAGLSERGWAVVMPSYTLAPEARIADMTREVARAIEAAALLVQGPIRITGHSAGGHLTARMGCRDVALGDATRGRIRRLLPISPLTDLRPLIGTGRNDTLHLDEGEATSESPVLHEAPDVPVSVWVGSEERPVFLDQAEALARHWSAEHRVDPGRHHFDILDGLLDADSPLIASLLR